MVADNAHFGVIIADPPWPYYNPQDHEPKRGGYSYPSMTIPEIMAYPVEQYAGDNCILLLWGTWPKLIEAVRVMGAWGFEHVTGFPWIKVNKDGVTPSYRIGYWIAGCSEYVLVGRRGFVSPPPPPRFLGLLSEGFLVGPHIREHSRKPQSLHEIGETLPGPWLELFARRPIEGWTCLGLEMPN